MRRFGWLLLCLPLLSTSRCLLEALCPILVIDEGDIAFGDIVLVVTRGGLDFAPDAGIEGSSLGLFFCPPCLNGCASSKLLHYPIDLASRRWRR